VEPKNPVKTKLVLFDIDGTLLTTHGQSPRALKEAMERVYGCLPADNGYLMDGKTELRIVHELMDGEGFTRDQVEAGLEDFWQAYFDILEATLDPAGVTVYPGVRDLVRRLEAHPQVVMGLLTGNCEESSFLKLRAAGLAHSFAFGAYGQFEENREALPKTALELARWNCGVRFKGKSVVLLGDTPSDIQCGSPYGFHTIAVATGVYGAAQLEPHQPDSLFQDFSDLPAVLQAIGVK